ncbi:MAG: sigma-70 family RNA polymerase sigma factor [Myxococcota bacterium]
MVPPTDQRGIVLAEFRAMYDAELSSVWHALRRFGVEERHLEDAVHEVFLVVHRRFQDYDRARPIRPWLRGIAYKVASDFRKKASQRHEVPDEAPEIADPGALPDEQLDAAEKRRLVHAALERLNPDQRAVFVLAELEGLTMPEVSEALGINLNTAYSRLRLGREAFVKAVRAIGQGGQA